MEIRVGRQSRHSYTSVRGIGTSDNSMGTRLGTVITVFLIDRLYYRDGTGAKGEGTST